MSFCYLHPPMGYPVNHPGFTPAGDFRFNRNLLSYKHSKIFPFTALLTEGHKSTNRNNHGSARFPQIAIDNTAIGVTQGKTRRNHANLQD